MRSSRKELSLSIYLEHVEEASFLYEQRLGLLDDPSVGWMDIGEVEDRLDAHFDGLVVGGGHALKVCMDRTRAGDPGDLHAAVCVFCRQDRLGLLLKVLEGLDPDNPDVIDSVSHALIHEAPDHWADSLIRMLPVCRPAEVPILARVAGYRRLPAGADLLALLSARSAPPDGILPDILWALGRVRCQEAIPLLRETYLNGPDESASVYAALALLRMGDAEALERCMQLGGSLDWPNTLIGISGSRTAVSVLLKKASQPKPAASCLLGLGLLGDISAIETLLGHLPDPETAEAAAPALNLVTGAGLYEQVFIPEKIDEDELFEEEREGLKEGRTPVRPDGTPYGTTVERLSRKPGDWQDWWSRNRARFIPGVRYRNGVPFSPACLLQNMQDGQAPIRVRQLAYEELVIRYGKDFPFEADMYVSRQMQALAGIAGWVASDGARFRQGVWCFAGRPLEP